MKQLTLQSQVYLRMQRVLRHEGWRVYHAEMILFITLRWYNSIRDNAHLCAGLQRRRAPSDSHYTHPGHKFSRKAAAIQHGMSTILDRLCNLIETHARGQGVTMISGSQG